MRRCIIAIMGAIVPLLIVTGCRRNYPPDIPVIPHGVSVGWVDSTYAFFTVTEDPDGDNVSIQIDWGDGFSEWSDFVSGGTQVNFSHIWSLPESYKIRARARDIHNNESEWSAPHSIRITTELPPPAIPVILDPPDTVWFDGRGYEVYIIIDSSGIEYPEVSIQLMVGDSVHSWTGFRCYTDTVRIITNALTDIGHYLVRVRARNRVYSVSPWSEGDTAFVLNRYPYQPEITAGPISGFASTLYDFTAKGDDPDLGRMVDGEWRPHHEQLVAYQFVWGDGDSTDFSMLILTPTYTFPHAYMDTAGLFSIRVRTRDRFEAWSELSDPWDITIINLFETQFGEGPNPTGIATDGKHIYVAYFGDAHGVGGAVKKFDMGGNLIEEWEDFSSPRDVAVDDYYLYVTEWAEHRILKLNKLTGEKIDSFGVHGEADSNLIYPCGITVDIYYIYVTEFGNNRINKFSKDGEHIKVFGEEGDGAGQFQGPMGITMDGMGNLYIADTRNNRVQVWTTDGEFVREWGEVGTGDGQFMGTQGIFWYGGFLYVVDTGNNRLQVLTEDGEFKTRWGMMGSDPGQLFTPHSLMVHQGRVYVADTVNGRVKVFQIPVIL